MYSTIQVGAKNTEDYKIYLTRDNCIISPWHDISPMSGMLITCVNEIPRFTNAKLEIDKVVDYNPIKQDIKKGRLRFVSNIFPLHGYPWNYGAIPQTWENPNVVDSPTGTKGDNDPLDVIEIGDRVKGTGEVYDAKVLGCLVMIDEGECDYKIVVVDVNCKMAKDLNDIQDVSVQCPGLLEATRVWFRDYKIPDGKSENSFAFDGEFMNKEFAMGVIGRCHEEYKTMFDERKEDFAYSSGSTAGSTIVEFEGEDDAVPEEIEKFYFIKR